MNRLQFQIQVSKAVIVMKRKNARTMKTGPKKTALLKEIAKLDAFLKQIAKAQKKLPNK